MCQLVFTMFGFLLRTNSLPAGALPTNNIRRSSIFYLQTREKHNTPSRTYSVHVPSSTPYDISKRISHENEDYCEFAKHRSTVIEGLTKSEEYADIPWITRWYEKILSHNLQGGKHIRGFTLLEAYRALSSSKPSPETSKLADLMAWCVEMVHVFYLVHDDLVDDAETRRNQPCWFRLNDNGLNAINDGVLLENGVYQILKKYFKNQPYYTNAVELFHDTIFKTTMGQILDSRVSKNFRINRNLEEFTPDVLRVIVKYKTTYYTYQLPVSLAMYMAGIQDDERHAQISEILFDIGNYFQTQDDFMDCFGDPTVTGKLGTDIQEGKCTWPLVTALQKVNDDQKSKLQKCYGTSKSENVAAVKKVFEDVGIKEIYVRHQEENYNNITIKIQALPDNTSIEILLRILKKLYRRSS